MKEKERPRLTTCEDVIVPVSIAMCESDRDARMLLYRVLEDGEFIECLPMEASSGRLHFATARDGRGYTLSYETEPVGTNGAFLRVVGAKVERNEDYDLSPKEYQQYRVTFYDRSVRMDPLEFAWLLSKHDIDVVGMTDESPMLFVHARNREALLAWTHGVNRAFGPLIFETIEGAGPQGYEEIEF